MYIEQEPCLNLITLGLIVFSTLAILGFRTCLAHRSGYLAGVLVLATMALVAGTAGFTLFYDFGAAIVQGVTLVGFTVGITFHTRNTPAGDPI